MRNKISISIVFALLLFSACENELKEEVTLTVSTTSAESKMSGDTLIVNTSAPVVFSFAGNPDFISFYSGESGSEYSKRTETLLPADEITSLLSFSTMPQYGIIPGTLKVFLSTTFTGLYLNNKVADSTLVVNHAWIDITADCNLPTVSVQTKPASIPLDEYMGKKLTIAFLYQTERNDETQPVWEILNLGIINTLKANGRQLDPLPASTMGFAPLDMYAVGNAAYNTVSSNVSGTWNLANIANATAPKMRIHSSSKGAPINTDWLISKPIVINARVPDTGVGIKNVSQRLDSYTYKFDKSGTYHVTFVASNNNYAHASEVVKQVLIKVVDKTE